MVGDGMNPGELNCRITLQKETKVPDDQGGYEVTYLPRYIVWGKVAALTAKTSDEYEQDIPEIFYRVTIRYLSDVAVTDRLQYGSRIFELLGPPIDIEEKHAYLRLECREVVADASTD